MDTIRTLFTFVINFGWRWLSYIISKRILVKAPSIKPLFKNLTTNERSFKQKLSDRPNINIQIRTLSKKIKTSEENEDQIQDEKCTFIYTLGE